MAARKGYLTQATELTYSISNDTIRLDHLSRVSLAYKRLDDSIRFRQMNRRVLNLAAKSKLYKAQGESHWDMASFLKSYGVMDSAFYQYRQALKSFQQLPSDSTSLSLKGRILYSMGDLQDYFKDYLGAEVSATEALRIFENLKDYKRIYNCNNLLGVIVNGMNNHNKSLEYYQRAGSYLKKLEKSDGIELTWENKNNIAFVYLENQEFSKSEQAYLTLHEDSNLKTSDPSLHSKVKTSLAYSIFKGKQDLVNAKNLVLESIRINDSFDFSEDQARAKQFYAEILAAEGDTTNAKKSAEQSLALAIQTSNSDHHLEVLRLLTSLDSDNAVAYSNEYYDLNEKIKEEERAKRDKFARIRMETDEVIQENEVLSRGKLMWTYIALGFLLTGVALYIIFAQRASNNKLKYEQQQQEANQEIYNLMLSQQGKLEEGKKLEQKRVSEELHDGTLSELLGIRLMLSGLNGYTDENAMAQRADYLEKLKDVAEGIRTISHELSNASYQKFYNFIVSLEELIHTIESSSGIQCSFVHEKGVEWDALDGNIKINVYRIVQESLQNCVKHAKAKMVHISFMLEEGTLKLAIMDDGVGFDTDKGKNGIGLRNLISRVQKLNGTLDVNSTVGKGTTILVELPAKYIGPSDPSGAEERKQILNA